MKENKTKDINKRQRQEEKSPIPASSVHQPRRMMAKKDLVYFLLLKLEEAH